MRRILGVEETRGLGLGRNEAQAGDCLARVAQAGSQRGSRIAGQLGEQRVHTVDLGLLVADHVIGELEHHRLVGTARGLVQGLDHGERALVMLDHQTQELAVEIRSAGCREFGHLGRRRHALHDRMARVTCVHGMVHRNRFAARFQPLGHEGDFVLLRGEDTGGDLAHRVVAGAVLCKFRHLDRLPVVGDHALHEHDIARRVGGICKRNRFFTVDYARCFARRSGQNDRHFLRQCCVRSREQHARNHGAKCRFHVSPLRIPNPWRA